VIGVNTANHSPIESVESCTGMAALPPSALRQRHRCIAMTSQSLGHRRCRNPSILGGFTCRFHGGATPQARRAAEERLGELVGLAAGRLFRLMQSDDEQVALRACAVVLRQPEVAKLLQEAPRNTGHDELASRMVDELLASVRSTVVPEGHEAAEPFAM